MTETQSDDGHATVVGEDGTPQVRVKFANDQTGLLPADHPAVLEGLVEILAADDEAPTAGEPAAAVDPDARVRVHFENGVIGTLPADHPAVLEDQVTVLADEPAVDQHGQDLPQVELSAITEAAREAESDSTLPGPTVDQLKAAIAERNADRGDDDQIVVGGKGNKADLIAALQADDLSHPHNDNPDEENN